MILTDTETTNMGIYRMDSLIWHNQLKQTPKGEMFDINNNHAFTNIILEWTALYLVAWEYQVMVSMMNMYSSLLMCFNGRVIIAPKCAQLYTHFNKLYL